MALSFNRTLMELKPIVDGLQKSRAFRFNRTLMELKLELHELFGGGCGF